MVAIPPGGSSSLASPLLTAFCATVTPVGLMLADPYALAFAIDDLHDPLAPAAQIYPAPAGATVAAVECAAAGPYALADGQTLLVRCEDGATQTLVLTAAAFALIGGAITNAAAWQVAAVVNELLAPGKSYPSSGASKVTIASDVPGAGGSVQVLGGTANAVLGFPAGKVTGSGGTAGRQPIDLVNDRQGLGRFVAPWTAPTNAAPGRYRVRWYLTQNAGELERSWARDFEVLTQPAAGIGYYGTIADVRAEGVTVKDATDARIAEALDGAARLIEIWTGRVFEPRYKAVRVDANQNPPLLFDEPIAALEGVTYDGDSAFADLTSYRVYNRHLSEGLLSPDDRASPKIDRPVRTGLAYDTFYASSYYLATFADLLGRGRSGAQQIQVGGVWGYTDYEPGGAPCGATPRNIVRAAVMIALRGLPKQGARATADRAFDARYGHRVTQDRTREQTRTWAPRLASDQAAPFTGDPAIDSILLTYAKPLTVRAA